MATPKLSALKSALFKLFETFDENNDKLIDFDEFKKAMIESNFVKPNAPQVQQKISQLFAMFDTDNSGTIKYTELTNQDSKFIEFLNQLNIKFINDSNVNEDAYEKIMLQYKDEKEALEANLKLCMQKNEAMSEEIEQLHNEKKMLSNGMDDLKTEINELKKDKIELQSLSTKLIKNNSNDNYFEKQISELTGKLHKTSENLEKQKRENNKLLINMKSVSNKLNKLQNINKQLKYDNNQLLESTDELTVYCTELEVNLEMAENKISDFNNESLYDNMDSKLIHTPIESRGSLKGRERTATITMLNYDRFKSYDATNDEVDDDIQNSELYDSVPELHSGTHNRQRSMQFLRHRSYDRSRAVTAAVNIVNDVKNESNYNNENMEDIKNMLMTLQTDLKTLNNNVNDYQQQSVYETKKVNESNVKSWWEWW